MVTNDSIRFFVKVKRRNPDSRVEVDSRCGRKVPEIGEQVGHGYICGLWTMDSIQTLACMYVVRAIEVASARSSLMMRVVVIVVAP